MATGTWSCLRSRAAPTGSRPRRPNPGSSSSSPAAPATSARVLTQRLLDRGYHVRILDRLYWGRGPISPILDRVELIEADVRDMPASALDGVDGVIHLAGLSNDPTAEYDPEANWQMNAIATRDARRATASTATSSGSSSPRPARSTTACPRACTTRPRRSSRAAPTRPPSATARRRCWTLVGEGLCPVILRNGTVYGHSPRMRFDLVVNTFVKDALLKGQLSLHGGGWMWRPLVDVRDVSDAMIATLEAPADLVRGEIFNVLHSNYQIRELAMLVAGSVQLMGRNVVLEEEPAPKLTRDYECSNTKLARRLGFQPSRSVVEAIDGILASIDVEDKVMLTDPRFYNIRWLELLSELTPQIDQFRAAL